MEGTASLDRAGDHAEAVPTCRLEETVEVGRARMDDAGTDICVVVNARDVVAGVLRRDGPATEARAGDVMRSAPTTFRPGVDAHKLAHRLDDAGVRVAILTTADGRLAGVFRPRT